MKNIIEVIKLTKRYKNIVAVDDVSFNVQKGEIFGFLGPNGAGKSTTINILSTLVGPTSGTAKINGFDINQDKVEVRKSIGIIFQEPSLDDRLTAKENLEFHARLYGVPYEEYIKKEKETLELVGLWDRRNEMIINFSGGMKRRVELARLMLHKPKLLFLDEPTRGLDPQSRVFFWDYILKLNKEKGTTIFLTTHYMNEAEHANHIAVMDHGRIIALDTPSNLKKLIGGDIVNIKSRNNKGLKKEIESKFHIGVKERNGTLVFSVSEGEIFIPRLFKNTKCEIDMIEFRKPTLDDVFIYLTGRKIREG